MKTREFYCFKNGCASSKFKQFRQVPQGAALSPMFFNILMSSILHYQDVEVPYTCADDPYVMTFI